MSGYAKREGTVIQVTGLFGESERGQGRYLRAAAVLLITSFVQLEIAYAPTSRPISDKNRLLKYSPYRCKALTPHPQQILVNLYL
ncbi:hypothetical protein HZ326_26126 [Fusarium oxysporum f. sp. albedinis]|nr:hypothetical protein HZ326_26126 [Fusarium oxysporum f. sp. albedinis]